MGEYCPTAVGVRVNQTPRPHVYSSERDGIRRMRPDRRSAVKTVLRIVRTLVVALVVLFVVAVGVGIFGVLEEDDGMARRWPKRP
jgi:hypothetical protein